MQRPEGLRPRPILGGLPVFTSRSRIITRLTAGFAALLLLTVIMAGLAVRTLTTVADLARDLYEHPFAVTNAIMRIEAQIQAIRADVLLMMVNRSADDVAVLSGRVAAKEAEMAAALDVLRNRYLGPPEDVAALAERLTVWKATREDNLRLLREGRYDDAAENARRYARPQTDALRREMATIYAFAQAKAGEFNNRIVERHRASLRDIVLTLLGLLVAGLIMARLITRSIVRPLDELRHCMHRLAEGDLRAEIPVKSRVSEVVRMAAAVEVFRVAARRLDSRRRVEEGIAQLSQDLQQAETETDLAAAALDRLVPLCGAGVAAFHIRRDEPERFERIGAWGLAAADREATTVFLPGEGLAGEAARTGRILEMDRPADARLAVSSTLVAVAPGAVLAAPARSHGRTLAVLELASLAPFDEEARAVLDAALPVLALNLEILDRNLTTRRLLGETQAQAEELRAQGDSLEAANEELRASEEELRVQQEALQAANEELQLKSEALEERGAALEAARVVADRRAEELERAGRYKSEFLANMSHELRTPLNSVLILARDLADNRPGTLTAEQVESAHVIHESGSHLLALINDVLDLSKVEAGKMSVNAAPVRPADLADLLRRRYAPIAGDKRLAFLVEVQAGLSDTLSLDQAKIEQIAGNLIGNAVKFTTRGEVRVTLGPRPEGGLILAVADTGIGIAEDDRERIFSAFEQVDGGPARRFGGTGLGLTISRRLARLMGGDITLAANPKGGSLFTLSLPEAAAPAAEVPAPPAVSVARPAPPQSAAAPSTELDGAGRTLLVVEDDPVFTHIVRDLATRKGFDVLTAADGATGLELARKRRPAGIVLDIGLPDMSGWEVIDALGASADTRSIPVHVISAGDDGPAGRAAAVGRLTKPVTREQIEDAFAALLRAGPQARRPRLLLVAGDAGERTILREALSGLDAEIVEAESGAVALDGLARGEFDCLVAEAALPDMTGGEFLERAQARTGAAGLPPAVICSAAELTPDQVMRVREFTDSIVIMGARASERLLDEVGLFLHSVKAKRPEAAAPEPSVDDGLAGVSVLVVDDDMRNAFALSKALRARGLKVLIAQDGAKALNQLNGPTPVDLVLMDVMMPGMDGLRTIEEIRRDPRFARLPVVTLTAKAMPGDRDRCLEAGADDHMTKPVDVGRLCGVMAALLRRGGDD